MKAAGSSHHHHQQEQRAAYRALCCGCTCNSRLSFSSSEETESFSSERFPSVSSIAHAMVQERLDQMIREKREIIRNGKERKKQRSEEMKFVVMVAMEKCSNDPKEDFRVSMMEMILANRIEEPKDLRNLLNYYISMNSDECHGVIFEVFHEAAISHNWDVKVFEANAVLEGLKELERKCQRHNPQMEVVTDPLKAVKIVLRRMNKVAHNLVSMASSSELSCI